MGRNKGRVDSQTRLMPIHHNRPGCQAGLTPLPSKGHSYHCYTWKLDIAAAPTTPEWMLHCFSPLRGRARCLWLMAGYVPIFLVPGDWRQVSRLFNIYGVKQAVP